MVKELIADWELVAFMMISFIYQAYLDGKEAEKMGCNKLLQQCKCEKAGGVYLTGGWGAANCSFPPK